MLWSGLETAFMAGASLVVSVVLARLLDPAVFGLVALLQIFIALGQLFAEAGMSQALIRLPSRTAAQEGTALCINLAAGVAVYALLWALAPAIAGFYGQSELTDITRLIGLCIPLNAACVVQTARLTSLMRFRTLAWMSVCAVCVSGVTGIVLALRGGGVMALVWQQIAMWGTRGVLLWTAGPAPGRLRVSAKAARELTWFSWKLLASGVIDTVWNNIYAPLVGRFFGVSATAMFWRAQTLAFYAPQAFGSVLARVSLPALSRIREEQTRATAAFSRLTSCSAWVMMPLSAMLIALAAPLFSWVLTDKWLPAAGLFQVLCLTAAFYPIHLLNCTALNVWGRSDLFLRLEILKKLIGLGALCVSLPFGVEALCWGMLCASTACLFLNMAFGRRNTRLGIRAQLRLLAAPVAGAALAYAAALGVSLLPVSAGLRCLGGGAAGCAVYLAFTRLMRLSAPRDIINLFHSSKETTT